MDRRPEGKGKGKERTPPRDVNRTMHEERCMQISRRETNSEEAGSFSESESPNSHEDLIKSHLDQLSKLHLNKRKRLDAIWKEREQNIGNLNARDRSGVVIDYDRKKREINARYSEQKDTIKADHSSKMEDMKLQHKEQLRSSSSPQPFGQSPSEEQGHRSWE